MNYLFDTDHITLLQRAGSAEHACLRANIAQHPRDGLFFSIVSFHEQLLGCHVYINRARTPSELERGYALLNEILAHYHIVPVVGFNAASIASSDQLSRRYPRIGRMDLRIAAIALDGQMTLLTRNRSDFGQIAGLSLEDWTR